MFKKRTPPLVMQGTGGQLYYFFGNSRSLELLNMTFMANTNSANTVTVGKSSPNRAGFTINTPVETAYFAGYNTIFPGSYANHKPFAIYDHQLYQSVYIPSKTSVGTMITRFDGSGLFSFQRTPRRNLSGRGTEILTSSGTSSVSQSVSLKTYDLSHLVYNDVLWMFGRITEVPLDTDNMFTIEKWKRNGNTAGANVGTKTYGLLSINIDVNGKEDRRIGPLYSIGANSSRTDFDAPCDMIGWKNDLYFANYVDVVKISQCSGTLTRLYNDESNPTTRSLSVYPSGGFSADQTVGEPRILMMTGSGVLYNLHASGVNEIVDLNSIRNDPRVTDNWFARINSAIDQPARSCLALPFAQKFHAFAPTATSGYRHFSCTGDPSGVSNWVDSTDSLPDDLKRFDSNVYGYEDGDYLYISQVTMGDLGIWGHVGSSKTAGAIYLYRMSRQGKWQELYQTAFDLPSRGLIPYLNSGPSVFVASGTTPSYMKCSDYTILDYELVDNNSKIVDVEVQYTENDGITWNNASRFKNYSTGILLGSGTTGLVTSPQGVKYDFYWNHPKDLGYNTNKRAGLRIKPRLS